MGLLSPDVNNLNFTLKEDLVPLLVFCVLDVHIRVGIVDNNEVRGQTCCEKLLRCEVHGLLSSGQYPREACPLQRSVNPFGGALNSVSSMRPIHFFYTNLNFTYL